MAKTYQHTTSRRLVNWLMRALLRLGLAPRDIYLLTVRGRKSGRLYSTPVNLVEENNQRWLVAPYGPVNWVLNARAAGQVTLSRGAQSETVSIVELAPEEGAPVLNKYLAQVPIVQPYFDVGPDAHMEDFVVEVSRHPVFRIQGKMTDHDQ